MFAQNIYNAGVDFLDKPEVTPLVPSWKRVMDAIPDVLELFNKIVEEDNEH